MKRRAKTKQPVLPISPAGALYGQVWVEETLAAVVGMWRDRRDIDPVEWQRQLRDEWQQNGAGHLRCERSRSKSRR